ncbi:uncharacterized protein LOC117182981 [Belonocnema kinseyi]|uniref:uncharacterized protein LOC117182981 n=1 Tax=Belonocnema kinseyi TaxID=2817044 RepID=UPI00143D0DB5|nr:uncharacterized protein LOC117182981 [Belonocnema kinseyi]
MYGDNFKQWFVKILPSLDDNCVIVMDNAPYHSVKEEKVPNTTWNIPGIINWLHEKGFQYADTILKIQLLDVLQEVKPQYDKYVIDEIAKRANKTVFRSPHCYCELNPIELVWSKVKGYVKSNKFTFKIEDVNQLLHERVGTVTQDNWTNYVKHTIEAENKLWRLDDWIEAVLAEIGPIIINVGYDTSSDSESFLDSDQEDPETN